MFPCLTNEEKEVSSNLHHRFVFFFQSVPVYAMAVSVWFWRGDLKTALPMALSVDTKKLTVKTKAINFGQDEI